MPSILAQLAMVLCQVPMLRALGMRLQLRRGPNPAHNCAGIEDPAQSGSAFRARQAGVFAYIGAAELRLARPAALNNLLQLAEHALSEHILMSAQQRGELGVWRASLFLIPG